MVGGGGGPWDRLVPRKAGDGMVAAIARAWRLREERTREATLQMVALRVIPAPRPAAGGQTQQTTRDLPGPMVGRPEVKCLGARFIKEVLPRRRRGGPTCPPPQSPPPPWVEPRGGGGTLGRYRMRAEAMSSVGGPSPSHGRSVSMCPSPYAPGPGPGRRRRRRIPRSVGRPRGLRWTHGNAQAGGMLFGGGGGEGRGGGLPTTALQRTRRPVPPFYLSPSQALEEPTFPIQLAIAETKASHGTTGAIAAEAPSLWNGRRPNRYPPGDSVRDTPSGRHRQHRQ